jgi:putative intracellular protease/amidase
VVAAVVGQGALTFDLAVPCEVFGLDRSDIASPWYEFRLVAADRPPIRTNTGFTIDTPYRLEHLADADTVIVPGWSDPEHRPSAGLVAQLCAAHARGARVVSLCTGAFVLADAGLLRGRRATTHWLYADRLRARAPGCHCGRSGALSRRRRRVHVGRHRGRDRPTTAPRGSTTHTAPPPSERSQHTSPTATVATVRPVAGSTRYSAESSGPPPYPATQIASRVASALAAWASVTVRVTAFVAGSTRDRVAPW